MNTKHKTELSSSIHRLKTTLSGVMLISLVIAPIVTAEATPKQIVILHPVVADNVKLLVLAGHDTNLSNMAGVFGLELRVEGQPDSTAPATVLTFELWRDVKTKTDYIKPRVFYLELA
ncbi:MAG: hypothetical protein LM550_16920 [Candidatus Contendobacter sp.]|nr:hypothetical protein [Gammaproteobacteria bacterium]MCC8995323.1 hypothetical protein [Candidatus Contendobacter sp.]